MVMLIFVDKSKYTIYNQRENNCLVHFEKILKLQSHIHTNANDYVMLVLWLTSVMEISTCGGVFTVQSASGPN